MRISVFLLYSYACALVVYACEYMCAYIVSCCVHACVCVHICVCVCLYVCMYLSLHLYDYALQYENDPDSDPDMNTDLDIAAGEHVNGAQPLFNISGGHNDTIQTLLGNPALVVTLALQYRLRGACVCLGKIALFTQVRRKDCSSHTNSPRAVPYRALTCIWLQATQFSTCANTTQASLPEKVLLLPALSLVFADPT